MVEARRKAIARVLDELCHSVAADGGAALYLDDGDGALQRVATSGCGGLRPPRLLDQLRDEGHDPKTLVLTVPGTPTGVMVLSRKIGGNFTQQDRAVARVYVRRLVEGEIVNGAPLARSVWTHQLEAIQRIGARLNRLGSTTEVGATICRGTFDITNTDEAHVLLADDHGYLQPLAEQTRDGGAPAPLPYDGAIAGHIARAVALAAPVLERSVADAGVGRTGAQSLLIVPLLHEGRVNGLVCLVGAGEGRFDDDHARLMQILSDQAAVAIENARLLFGRDELVQELAGLLEVSETAGAASDERQLASSLAARMRRATNTDVARVSRWDEGSTVLRLLGRDGLDNGEETVELAESPLRWSALKEAQALVIQVDALDHGSEAQGLRAAGVRTVLLLPLTAGGRTIGLVELIALAQPRDINESQLDALEAMASLTATGLERVRLVEQLRSAADIDLVTGVHNHRYLQDRLRQEVARAARHHSQLAVLMMDLDRFKQVNDRYGHADGDGVLRSIGATIMAELRTTDVVARYGGDEFVVIMPDTTVEQAESVAHRVVRAIIDRRHVVADGAHVSVGVSAGLAIYPADGRTSAELLNVADAAMYGVKRGGREVERPSVTPLTEAVVSAN
jgi:diguanylate cyclase (GGDEF)-like protein